MNKSNLYFIEWGYRHAFILEEIIKELTDAEIKFFILRNYEGLPEYNLGKDVDILIEPGSYKVAANIVFSVFSKQGLSHFKLVRYERGRCWYGIDIKNKFSIHIDLIEGYLSRGYEVFGFQKMFDNTVEYRGFRVLGRAYDSVLLLYTKVIMNSELKLRYINRIKDVYAEESEAVNLILKETLTPNCFDMVSKSLENDDYESIVSSAKLLSIATKRVAFLKAPMKTIWNRLAFLFEKFVRIVICPRRYQNFISVLGPDGTGKTTFINGLVKAISFFYVNDESKCHIYHHRPTILPNLGAVGEKAGVMKEDRDFTTPHRAKPSGFLGSFIRMTYYWLDYFLGVPVKLRRDVQFDRYTIYDRYIYDFLIDPFRSRINLPYWLRKLFTKLVVQPRIVFVLLTDAETIYARKQELTLDEINRQLGEFERLATSHKRFVVLDASKNPQDIVDDAMKYILNEFTEKVPGKQPCK